MNALEKAQALFEELESLRPLSTEDEQRIMQKFRLDWNYHSNHLEGNQLTFGETKALILFNVTAQGKPLKDHIEMTGHNEAIEWIMDVIKEGRPMTENFIRHLHQLLLKEPYKVDAITPDGQPTKKLVKVGEYKSTPNHVKTNTGEIFRFASPEETPGKMYDLLEWYRAKKDTQEKNPIFLAAEFHYKFIRIHPFDDGNGRLARILMNFILMSFRFPPVVIKTEDKENYFAVLRLADAGQFDPFVAYIAENLTRSLELMIKGARGESVEEPDDLEKEIILLQNRLNEVAPQVQIIKTRESVSAFLTRNFKRVFDSFHKRNQLFDKLYFKRDYFLHIGERQAKYPDHKTPPLNNRFGVNEDLDSFVIVSYHHIFKTIGLENLTFEGRLDFKFKETLVECHSNFPQDHKLIIKKYYDEDLSDDEIDRLVRPIIREHKQKIEESIDKKRT